MGTLTYDASTKVEFDDRALAHLRVVIGAKLRRGEPFYPSWRDDRSAGEGSSTIWLHPAASLRFTFHGSRDIVVNRQWIEELMTMANSSGGLRLTPEPPSGAVRRIVYDAP